MPEKKGARLDFDERWEIEDMLKESSPFREIARKLGVSPTTVSSEVKLNRAFFKPKAMQSRTLRRRPNSASCRSACRCRLRHGRSMRDKAQPCRSPGTSSSATAPSPAPKGGAKCAPFVCAKCRKRDVLHLREGAVRRLSRPGGSRRALARPMPASPANRAEGHGGQGEGAPCARTEHLGHLADPWIRVPGLRTNLLQLYGQGRDGTRQHRASQEGQVRSAQEEGGRRVQDGPCRPNLCRPARPAGRPQAAHRPDRLRGRPSPQLEVHPRASFRPAVLPALHPAREEGPGLCEGRPRRGGGLLRGILLGRPSRDAGRSQLGVTGLREDRDRLRWPRRTRMLYSDSVKPGQKGGCEKNHVELRKIPPKGTDFDAFAFDDVAKVCSHLNSYPRPNQGAAPIRLASLVLPVTCSRAWACAPFRPTTRS